MTVLKIALLTDLHAFGSEPANGANPPSRLDINLPETFGNQHPFTGLSELILRENLKTDLLMCGGDMCDKASPSGLQYVWKKLQDIKKALRSRSIIATSGNHDVDSRYGYTDHDAKGMLQALRPFYPD